MRVTTPLVMEFGGRRPRIAEGAWLAPGTVVVGHVEIGHESSVWYGATLRAEFDSIRIGTGTNVQDNVVVHVDRGSPVSIESDVSVGHGAVLHGCRVGTGTIIGMNATVLNGARVGPSSLVAAGSVVPSGQTFPERSLIAGVPARVRRELTDDEVQENLRQIREYVVVARDHRNALANQMRNSIATD